MPKATGTWEPQDAVVHHYHQDPICPITSAAVTGFMIQDDGPFVTRKEMAYIVECYNAVPSSFDGIDRASALLHEDSGIALFWGDDHPEAIIPVLLLCNGGDYDDFYRLPATWGWYDSRAV
jgi:hypothetical protein